MGTRLIGFVNLVVPTRIHVLATKIMIAKHPKPWDLMLWIIGIGYVVEICPHVFPAPIRPAFLGLLMIGSTTACIFESSPVEGVPHIHDKTRLPCLCQRVHLIGNQFLGLPINICTEIALSCLTCSSILCVFAIWTHVE